ncbi:MAG: GTP-binding protein [Eubacteriales bacterium]|nr:GTP-binding protein [Eubacteriales bacterium]
MIDEIQTNEIPVFLINGFLESGKTSFIEYTIGEEYFHIKGNTLLIVCEEGEVEYNTKLLGMEKTFLVTVDDKEMLTTKFLSEQLEKNRCERVIFEYNGMWGSPEEISFPKDWVLYQQITVMDGSTLGSYLNNMKALMGPMLRNTELCIVNRCDDRTHEELLNFKRQLRPMMQQGSMLVMENKYGEVELETLDEELPYDVKGSEVIIKPEHYGIWYLDARDYPERYLGKTVDFTARIMKNRHFEKNMFVPGRMSMTCCENDMAFLGYLARYDGIDKYQAGSWVHLKAKFKIEPRSEYEGEGPVLDVISMALTGEIKEPAGFY